MKRPYGVNLKRLGYRLLRIGIGCRLHWALRVGKAKPFFSGPSHDGFKNTSNEQGLHVMDHPDHHV